MKSPFPGMDPYLEQHWLDVHAALNGYIRDALQPQLPDDLAARMEESVYVESEDEVRRRQPDVSVVEMAVTWQSKGAGGSVAVLDQPMVLQPISDPIRQRSVAIYDLAGNRIVTAIELLSPRNKTPGAGLANYLEKREKYIGSQTNLVEIDLIRTGDWTKMIGGYLIPTTARTTYRVDVFTPEEIGPLHYSIPINSRLPVIKVPLRKHDQPVTIDLQQLIEKAYEMGRYDRIDYSKPCKPPLGEAEQKWVDTLIASSRTK